MIHLEIYGNLTWNLKMDLWKPNFPPITTQWFSGSMLIFPGDYRLNYSVDNDSITHNQSPFQLHRRAMPSHPLLSPDHPTGYTTPSYIDPQILTRKGQGDPH